jgi:hypothetical protein
LAEKLPPLTEALAQGTPISYTQWEAWLALYHGTVLLIAKADDAAPRGPAYALTDASRAAQEDHLKRLRAAGRYPGNIFPGPDNLTSEIFSTAILDLLAQALALDYLARPPALPQPNNLPFGSLGALFKGREGFMQTLRTALATTASNKSRLRIGSCSPRYTSPRCSDIGQKPLQGWAVERGSRQTAILVAIGDEAPALMRLALDIGLADFRRSVLEL